MAAYVLSPERWANAADNGQQQQQQQQQQSTPTGPAAVVGLRRRISRVFYESPVASPVALNLLHHPVEQVVVAEEDEDLAAVGVLAVERFLPQRRSPGQRSQDSGFSGYSGDSASEGSSNNNSPVPAAAAAVANNNNNNNNSGHKRSPLVDPEAAERALAEPDGVLETDVDAAAESSANSGSKMHVSRIYIRTASPLSAAAAAATAANLNLRDVLCEKNIQPVNLSGGSSSSSPDKCVGDKSLIGAVLASTNGCRAASSLPGCGEADRSCDSQTALLLEHKSIVPPSSLSAVSLRPNMSWKKLSESFRRVISSGRMMAASSSPQSCLPASSAASDCGGDESFTDEEKSRMLLLAKRSNVRRMKQDHHHSETTETGSHYNNPQQQQQQHEEGGSNYQINRMLASESPQPTSRYVGGPRSSTPRKTLPAIRYQNNHRRQCSRWSSSDDRPRVHWADVVVADPIASSSPSLSTCSQSQDNNYRKQQQQQQQQHHHQQPAGQRLAAAMTNSIVWPDNSIWDSDTPSLEIGQQVSRAPMLPSIPAVPVPTVMATSTAVAAARLSAAAPATNRPRRGLRMGVGSADRTLVHHSPLKSSLQLGLLPPPPPPPVIPAPIEFRSVQPLPPPFLPNQTAAHYGLRWSPVEAWLKDLPMFYQPESTCALQNKAIQQQQLLQQQQQQQQQRRSSSISWMTDDSCSSSSSSQLQIQQLLHHQSDDEERTFSATVTARTQVRRLQRRAHLISTEFAQLCSFIELYEEAKLSALIPLFLAHVIQFIREAELAVLHQDEDESSNKLDNNNNSEELILTLRQTCAQLVQIVTFSTHPLYMMMSEPGLMDPIDNVPPPPVNWSLARQITAKLGQVFVSIVDTFVGREIQVLTAALESGKCISAARLAANSLMSLGADAARPAMRPLIQAFQTPHLRPVWADLLRALSALCSSADIIQDFEMYGGLAVVFDVLCNPRSQSDLEEKSEAAGLLAQITSPWLDPPMEELQNEFVGEGEPHSSGVPVSSTWPTLHLTPYISSFVAALTELSSQTETEETLLLSTAALANLTFSHGEAVQLMAKYRTAQVLVQASGLRKEMSVFIQDQIATILANMAAVYSVRADLVSHGSLVTLLSFLQVKPSPLQRPAEITASERVLKKSAIALSRVCGEGNAARQIVELNGIERLAQLVRDPRERNHSDGVLVACLAALHKIATACGMEELNQRGASDLTENRKLLDVFIEYSSRPESYV